ncbi:MAG: hypothetical protein Q9168_006110 [Polycauliona sp. 1 TL-2023]
MASTNNAQRGPRPKETVSLLQKSEWLILKTQQLFSRNPSRPALDTSALGTSSNEVDKIDSSYNDLFRLIEERRISFRERIFDSGPNDNETAEFFHDQYRKIHALCMLFTDWGRSLSEHRTAVVLRGIRARRGLTHSDGGVEMGVHDGAAKKG